MNTKVIAVWLTIALIGVLLYMLPALLKQLFKVKEAFVAEVQEIRDNWKFERPTLDEHFVSSANPSDTKGFGHIGGFGVGGAGGVMDSQPAPFGEDITGPTPMEMQGMIAQRTVKAPASVSVDGFQGTGSPAPAPASTGSGPSPAPATAIGPSPAPTAARGPAPAPAPSCGYFYDPNNVAPPVYSCNGKIVDASQKTTGNLPNFMNPITTRDGLDDDEVAILTYWMTASKDSMPGWVQQLAMADTITPSEKKAFAQWASDNTPAASKNIIRATGPTTSNTSSSSKPASTTTTSSTKKKCKPKPKAKCPPKGSKEPEKCKGPIDMGEYIRKDSIPCWSCSL